MEISIDHNYGAPPKKEPVTWRSVGRRLTVAGLWLVVVALIVLLAFILTFLFYVAMWPRIDFMVSQILGW